MCSGNLRQPSRGFTREARMALTAKRVAKLIRKGEPGRHLDGFQGKGLYLVVASPTAAHWERRYQLDGREHFHGLGSAFVFSLSEARGRNRRASPPLTRPARPAGARQKCRALRLKPWHVNRLFDRCDERVLLTTLGASWTLSLPRLAGSHSRPSTPSRLRFLDCRDPNVSELMESAGSTPCVI
jgi:hypothetical protein